MKTKRRAGRLRNVGEEYFRRITGVDPRNQITLPKVLKVWRPSRREKKAVRAESEVFRAGFTIGRSFAAVCRKSPSLGAKARGEYGNPAGLRKVLEGRVESIIRNVTRLSVSETDHYLRGFARGVEFALAPKPVSKKLERVQEVMLLNWPPPHPLHSKAELIGWLRECEPELFDADYEENNFRRELLRKKV